MTSIIIAALGVAGCAFFWRNWHISEGRRRVDQRHFRRAINQAADEIARLTPLAEIGLRVEGQPRDENGRFKAKAK